MIIKQEYNNTNFFIFIMLFYICIAPFQNEKTKRKYEVKAALQSKYEIVQNNH